MKYNFTLLLILLLAMNRLVAQPVPFIKQLDHQVFIDELNNSQHTTYQATLDKYDSYLSQYPDDIQVHIEKCKFIELAEYNYSDEYNPNQEAFDSCTAALLRLYPYNPDVLVYFTTFSYGDELSEIFEKITKSIEEHKNEWTKPNLGKIYFKMADKYFDDDEYKKAESKMLMACANDDQYRASMVYARILIELEKKTQAIHVLQSEKDTVSNTWHLSQKAALLLNLGAYKEALKLYDRISAMDSSFDNNEELARVMTGIEKFDLARKYLVADTVTNWKHERASLNLFLHDLQHGDAVTALGSYNAYRDLGYVKDGLAIYRLKLFMTHPFLPWKWKDITGVLALIALIVLLILVPSIWILPVYFIGHKWKIVDRESWDDYHWGLKSFWLISFLYLVASFASLLNVPEELYSHFDSHTFSSEITDGQKGFSVLLFMLILAFSALLMLFRVNLKVFIPKYVTIGQSIGRVIAWFILYKIFLGSYIRLGTEVFDFNIDDIATCSDFLLASKVEMKAFLSNYGNTAAYLMVGLLVPVYEEIIFRGIILESGKRYLHFGMANVLQAALFAGAHASLAMFPGFFVFGILAGLLNKKAGGLLPGIIFHSINNLLAIAYIIHRG